jgi:predicted PurR-regulated permease PerM
MEDDDTSRMGWLGHPNPLVRWGGRAWLMVGILALAWAVWQVAGILRIVIFPLVLAMFPAAVLNPLVDRFGGSGRSRAVVSLVATLGFVVVVAGVLALIGWQAAGQLDSLSEKLSSVQESLTSAVQSVPGLGDVSLSSALTGASSGSGGGGGVSAAVRAVGGLFTFGAEFFLGVVALFFYLRDGDRIGSFLVRLFPERHHDDARIIGSRSWATISGYIQGQTVVATFDGVLFAIGLLIIGVPLAFALGVVVFIGAFIPVVGSIVAGAIGVGVAVVDGGVVTGLIVLALIVGIQQLEGNVLAPIVLGRAVELHPLAVLAAITAGAAVLGPFGAIVAVPLAASIYHAAGYVREEVA